jgi:hypothetical protein
MALQQMRAKRGKSCKPLQLLRRRLQFFGGEYKTTLCVMHTGLFACCIKFT